MTRRTEVRWGEKLCFITFTQFQCYMGVRRLLNFFLAGRPRGSNGTESQKLLAALAWKTTHAIS